MCAREGNVESLPTPRGRDNESCGRHHSHAGQDEKNDEPGLEAIGRTRIEDCLEVARKVRIGIDPWRDVGGKREDGHLESMPVPSSREQACG